MLFNAVAFQRLSAREASAAREATSKPSDGSAQAAPAPRIEDAPPVVGEAPAPGPSPVKTPTSASPPLERDPKLMEILDAQDAFSAFWKQLDRVFKARDKLDEARYFQTVVASTADYLELQEPARSQFAVAAQAASRSAGDARRERDAAQKALPKKDKTDPAYAAYQQQRDAIDARYVEQVKAAVDAVRPSVDAARPRHMEFMSNAGRWLRNLAPPAK